MEHIRYLPMWDSAGFTAPRSKASTQLKVPRDGDDLVEDHEKSAGKLWEIDGSTNQWEFQDPKMEVLYHIPGHIFWGYSLKLRPYIGLIYGRYLQFRILKWPVNKTTTWKFIIYRKKFGKLKWKLIRQLWEIGMENSPLSPVSN